MNTDVIEEAKRLLKIAYDNNKHDMGFDLDYTNWLKSIGAMSEYFVEQSEPLPDSFESYMSEARDEFVLAIKNVERSNYLLTAVDSFLICFDQMRDRLAAASTVSEPTDAELTKMCMAVSEKSLEKEWAEPLGEDAIECSHPFKEVSQKSNNFYCNSCKEWI